MRTTKPIKRLFKQGAFAALFVVVGYLGAALVGAFVPGPRSEYPAGDTVSVYLLRGPIHYDILLPLDEALRARFDWLGLDFDHPGAGGLLFGWGGRDFYTTTGTYRDVSARAVWRGVTGDSSVMRVALTGPLQADWPVERLAISPTQFEALLNVLEDSFADRTPLPVAGFSDFDAFYAAEGRFHIFRTCNVWVGATLRAAGIPFGAWTPVPYAVTLSARRFAK